MSARARRLLDRGVRAPPQAVIDTLNFHQYAKKSRENTWVLEFYAPWCKHCQALEPEFEAAALLAGGDDPATLAKIDVTANQASARKYGVTQLPTVKLFRDGEMADEYSGQRTSGAIVDYRQHGEQNRSIRNMKGP